MKMTRQTFEVLKKCKDSDVRRSMHSPVYFSGVPPSKKTGKMAERHVSIKEALELVEGENPPVVVSYSDGHYWGFEHLTPPAGGAKWLQDMLLEREKTKNQEDFEMVQEEELPHPGYSTRSKHAKLEK